jgi:hypothetical protein
MSRSNHWRWQPRDSRGRFSYGFGSGGGGGDDRDVFAMKGFWKLPNWDKLVYIVAMIGMMAMVPGIILRVIAFLAVLLGSDAILNALLPDEEEESEE